MILSVKNKQRANDIKNLVNLQEIVEGVSHQEFQYFENLYSSEDFQNIEQTPKALAFAAFAINSDLEFYKILTAKHNCLDFEIIEQFQNVFLTGEYCPFNRFAAAFKMYFNILERDENILKVCPKYYDIVTDHYGYMSRFLNCYILPLNLQSYKIWLVKFGMKISKYIKLYIEENSQFVCDKYLVFDSEQQFNTVFENVRIMVEQDKKTIHEGISQNLSQLFDVLKAELMSLNITHCVTNGQTLDITNVDILATKTDSVKNEVYSYKFEKQYIILGKNILNYKELLQKINDDLESFKNSKNIHNKFTTRQKI